MVCGVTAHRVLLCHVTEHFTWYYSVESLGIVFFRVNEYRWGGHALLLSLFVILGSY